MPQLSNFIGFYQIVFATIAMSLMGRALLKGRFGPGMQMIAGWGGLCLVLTLFGVLVPVSMRIPAMSFVLAAIIGAAVWGRKNWRDDLAGAAKMVAVAAPLLWVMADIQPSQLDVLWLILPNAAYLFDHGHFPTAISPPAFSDAPVAPYNTEFVPFLGSLAGGGFSANGLSLFTVFLHLAAGLILARVLARGAKLGWGHVAFGLLLATVINPGFVPRISFSGYGEAPIAISVLALAWLLPQVADDLAKGVRWPPALAAVALTLAAMIAIKQQAVGMFLAVCPSLFLVLAWDRRVGWQKALRVVAVAAIPAVILYATWRGHVLIQFPNGELKSRALADWAWGNLPAILAGMGKVAFEKPYYFATVVAVLLLAVRPLACFTQATRLVTRFAALVIVLYTGFLGVVFVGHFGGEHSYFRYNTHLSLLIVLALVLAVQDLLASRKPLPAKVWKGAGAVAVVAMLAVPLASVVLLRFDRDMPQPLMQDLARNLAAELKPDDRIALLMTGDNFTSTMALSALLRFERPRRLGLDIASATDAEAATFDRMAASGYRLALVSCTDKAPALNLPPRSAVLMQLGQAGWSPVKVWPYPPQQKRSKFGWTRYIAGEPFCEDW